MIKQVFLLLIFLILLPLLLIEKSILGNQKPKKVDWKKQINGFSKKSISKK